MTTDFHPKNSGRLNTFQKAMLLWNEIAPYNAVHVARVPRAFDAQRLNRAIAAIFNAHGLGEISLRGGNGIYFYTPRSTPVEIKLVSAGATFESLNSEVQQQLSTPFPRAETFFPFRFFAAPGGDFFFLGLVYFHAIADAESIVLLLKDIVAAYLANASPALTPLDIFPQRRDRLRDTQPKILLKKIRAVPWLWKNMSVSDRYRGGLQDFQLGFHFFSVRGRLQKLSANAKRWDVTINDIFLALLLQNLSPCAFDRDQNSRRRSISVGCIVNLRRDLALPDTRAFGLFLGSFSVTHEVPPGISLEKLARDIRSQTRRVKDEKLCLGAPVQMAISQFFVSHFSDKFRRKFYAKQYPLYGGITNMNLNPLWSDAADYFRAVSTGPATPLVFSVTTVRDSLNIGVSYRTSVYTAEVIGRICGDFERAISELGS